MTCFHSVMVGCKDISVCTGNQIFQKTPKHKESFVIYIHECEKKDKIHNIKSYEAVQVQNAFAVWKFGGIHPQ